MRRPVFLPGLFPFDFALSNVVLVDKYPTINVIYLRGYLHRSSPVSQLHEISTRAF